MSIWILSILILLLNKKYYISETFICCSEHVRDYISWKILSRSRDPRPISRSNLRSKGQSTPTCSNLQNEGRFVILIDTNNTNFVKIGPVVPEIQGFKGRRPRPFLPKISKFGGSYLANPWPDWPKIWDLVLWDHTQQVYQVLSKSKMVGLNPLGDLTWNDPVASNFAPPPPQQTPWCRPCWDCTSSL